MFGVKDKPFAKAFSENLHELKPLLHVNGGAVEGYQPGDAEAQVNTNQPVPQPHGVRMSDVDVKGVRGSQPIGEDQVDNIFRSASGSAGDMIRASRSPLSGTAQEPFEVEEILRPGDDFRPGSDVWTVTDAKQIGRRSNNLTPSDEMDSKIDNGYSDNDEPVYCYEEPKETETVLDASQEDIGAETVPCYGRSPTLQKKVNELSFLIHYHSVDKMVKIFDEESEENQAKLLVQRDKDGLPCLIKALKRQSLDCIEPLLQRFNNLLPVFDKNGINKLDALMSNNLKNLFHIGAEIATDRDIIDAIEMCPLKEEIADLTDRCGATPLIVACQRQNHKMAVRLVSYKAKIDHVDNQGYSPIYLAAANGCADLLKMFLVHGTRNSEDCQSLISNKNLFRQKGTILQAIVESKNPDTFCVCIQVLGHHLIQECLKKELENDHQFFHKICRTPLVTLGKMAIEIDGTLLDEVDNHGMTPLMTATEAGQFDVVKLILGHERGRNTISRTRKSDKRTALMKACVEGYHDIAKYIMETCVVRLKDLDSMKRNVFHHAAKHTEVLEALIDVCCSKAGYKNFKEYLQKQDDYGYISLHLAAAVGSHNNVKLLLQNGVRYDSPSSRVSRLALHYAACTTLSTVKTQVEFVEANYGVEAMKAFIDAVDSRSQTSLHLAASLGKWRTVSYLLDKGATIKCDHEKETALHHASASGSLETVKCILKKQSNALNPSILNIENRVGETAAMFAAVEGHTEILQLLLKSGARLWGSSNGSERPSTCLDWAVDSKKSETAAAILEEEDWKETIERSPKGADGLLAKMVENMPDVALMVLNKSIEKRPSNEKVYDFFSLQTVEEVTTCGTAKRLGVAMQAIESMVKFSCDKCLRHDVVQTFLHRKWVSRIRQWWLFGLFLYTVFLISLTTYIGLVRKDEYSAEEPCVVITFGICIGFASLSVIKEFFQLWHKKLNYFLDFTTCVELAMYISVFIFLPNDEKSNLQWQAGAIAVFLGWINFIWFLKRFPAYGIYIIMVKKIFVTFLKVFVPLGFFIMAFAMTFFVLMPRDPGFKTIPLALVTSFAMMVGEVDYRDTFIDEQNRPKNFALIIVFVVISLIVMTILLMNLLTGLAVGDTGEILKRSMAEKRIQQALLIVDMEKYLKKYPCLGASFMEPFTESPKKLTGLAKMIGKLKEKLFPTLDSEGSDEVKKSSECQCATVKEQLNEIKTMLEAVQSHIENTQDRSIRRTSEFIKELQRKHRGSI